MGSTERGPGRPKIAKPSREGGRLVGYVTEDKKKRLGKWLESGRLRSESAAVEEGIDLLIAKLEHEDRERYVSPSRSVLPSAQGAR